ncbi:MAG: hypothetical protein A2504_05555 [Bdellovibrionales bacterium RIFOXYD12_FULL_39_22]|nr:MAG: hypothetical protein A2385_06270 [Bdellovibrionales bacterium RIFOXYB1_FULL_39_21]OFZ41884.1 MAG: hypothetical protein A2485_08240 [Bdellovibrionales bacterium RIFOXYC12_FULL_39_17]OFZ50600.1 MAG: hypothetical protein A2404_05190 [Bdellovibrionales bacterium RIFOXYC1_FULL_39_130]OFZ77823.1 MAG: hypothetical protein A2560_00360 [Bdellovibrionales bacterium RIFOXYD1_FULL_39_84]OFZ93741.1 MAG: hypothetical protein A2504_05555 [Bdellovibrionales bacterium RIFOXYD12_FULL_39_22]HLE11574.1 ly
MPRLEDRLSFNYSAEERLFALNLQELLKNLKQNIITPYNTDELVRLLPLAPAFSVLSSQVLLAKEIREIGNSINKFHQTCKKSNFTESKILSAILGRINLALHEYCNWKFLQISGSVKEFSAEDIAYLEEYLPTYLQNNKRMVFSKFLLNVKRRPAAHESISQIVANHYITQNNPPQSFIIDNIKISKELQNYIQGRGIGDEEAKDYYTTQFKGIYDAFKKSLKNEDRDLAKTYSDHLLSYYNQNKDYISATMACKTFLNIGPAIATFSYERALAIFQFALKISETPEDKMESQFQILWLSILQRKFDLAQKAIEKYGFIDRFASLDPKLQFWVAYCFKKNGEKYLARHLFSQLVQNSPLEYYAVTALEELKDLGYPITRDNLVNKIKTRGIAYSFTSNDYTAMFLNAMKRVALWSDLANEQLAYLEIKDVAELEGEQLFANKEIAESLSSSEQKKLITMHLSKLLTDKKQFLQTFKVIYKSLSNNILGINDEVVRMLFPFQYVSQIKKFGKEMNLAMVLALIRQESAFNPRAQSMVGARGLMQIMPNTAKQLKRNVTAGQLISNPDLNIQLGLKYLKQLMNKYDGNLVYTLAAYNAGERRLANWVENIFKNHDPLITVELIPFQETQQYVKYIYRNMFFYNLLGIYEVDNNL